jgi:hypothetical protein
MEEEPVPLVLVVELVVEFLPFRQHTMVETEAIVLRLIMLRVQRMAQLQTLPVGHQVLLMAELEVEEVMVSLLEAQGWLAMELFPVAAAVAEVLHWSRGQGNTAGTAGMAAEDSVGFKHSFHNNVVIQLYVTNAAPAGNRMIGKHLATKSNIVGLFYQVQAEWNLSIFCHLNQLRRHQNIPPARAFTFSRLGLSCCVPWIWAMLPAGDWDGQEKVGLGRSHTRFICAMVWSSGSQAHLRQFEDLRLW